MCHPDFPCAILDFQDKEDAQLVFNQLNGEVKVGDHSLPASFFDTKSALEQDLKVLSIRQGNGTAEQQISNFINANIQSGGGSKLGVTRG